MTHNEIQLTWLVDTGSPVTLMPISTFEQHFYSFAKALQSVDPTFHLSAATGTPLTILGSVALPFSHGGNHFVHDTLIVQNLPAGCILGNDFLSKTNAVIFAKTKTLQFPVATITQPLLLSKHGLTLHPFSDSKHTLSLNTTNTPTSCTGLVIPLNHSHHAFIREGLYAITQGQTNVILTNATPDPVTIPKGTPLASVSIIPPNNIATFQLCPISKNDQLAPSPPPNFSLIKSMLSAATEKCNLSRNFRSLLLALLYKYHGIISMNDHDLGCCKDFSHSIHLTDELPVHVKQFPIPIAHRPVIENHVKNLLAKGAIQLSTSPYNSPLFCVSKPHTSPNDDLHKRLRIVQDFRALNSKTLEQKYVMREISECITAIGMAQSTIFSTIDLKSAFWQLPIKPEHRARTAFTVPGLGHFEWTKASMGLCGSPGSFALAIDTIFRGQSNIITYVDDILIHSASIKDHLNHIETCFKLLQDFNLKLNLKKSTFCSSRVFYLGYELTSSGISPGLAKSEMLKMFPEPHSIRSIREFLGVANYYRSMIPNFTTHSAKLSALLKKDSGYKEGALPPSAKQAFDFLRHRLSSQPILNFPHPLGRYVLTTDASTGTTTAPGGFGAVLQQVCPNKEVRTIAYASRTLKTHEQNYSPFLAEMAAIVWAIQHFHQHLAAQRFLVRCDHKPLEPLKAIHRKTLNRLQEAMNDYDFHIESIPGKLNHVADFLSRHAYVANFFVSDKELVALQKNDEICQAVISFLRTNTLPEEKLLHPIIKQLASKTVVADDLLFFANSTHFRLYVPHSLRHTLVQASHAHPFSGHGGRMQTLAKLSQHYWWPNMPKDIAYVIDRCDHCQRGKKQPSPPIALLPLAVPDHFNQRVHVDLWGPQLSNSGHKYILVITCAFTKLVELAALKDKEAHTVAEAIFSKWVSRYSCPSLLVSDRGLEFANQILNNLLAFLHTKHSLTAAYNPQCNSASESYNRTIIRYLRCNLQGDRLDWPEWLPALMFSYNTAVHSTTMQSPFFPMN